MSQPEEDIVSDDEGLADLDEVTKVYLHLRNIHKCPGGLPPRAWELADRYVGKTASEDKYIIALHQAAHDAAEQNHEADLL